MWTEEKPDLDELMHFGVLGMRWGHRKGPSSSTSKSSKKIASKKKQLDKALADRKSANKHTKLSEEETNKRIKAAEEVVAGLLAAYGGYRLYRRIISGY